MSIVFNDVQKNVMGEISCNKRELLRAINRVIRDINSKLKGGLLSTELAVTAHGVMSTATALTVAATGKTITKVSGTSFVTLGFEAGDKLWCIGATESTNIVELTIATGGVAEHVLKVTNTVTNESIASGTLYSYEIETGYDFDPNTQLLTLSDNCKQILEIFENNDELENHTLEYVTDDNNDAEPCYHHYSFNEILLPTWILEATDDEIKVKIMKDISVITSDDGSTEIDIPQQYLQLLITGCLSYLYALPNYKGDGEQMKINMAQYVELLANIQAIEDNRITLTTRTRKYKY